ncbi:MAG: glycosyltransferase family 87 protein [Gemmatales bacterium]
MSRSAFIIECLCWPFQRNQRNVLAWVLAVVVTLSLIHSSIQDNVNGDETCDFAGQWMIGRTFYREVGPELYTVESGTSILAEGYKDKVLEGLINDILRKGYQKDLYNKGIGGALYPPTAGILFSLFAQFRPPIAHAVAVFAYLLMCFGSGWMISRITNMRLQWGEATLLVLFFPNNFMGLMLGQNQALTLFILTAGWYCKHRGWPFVAGLVWGCFAYKPVFAVAMLLVPLALRSPRWFMGMALSGLLWIAATIPYFGIEPWFRWLQVGRHAEQLYQVDRNWIWMSRDLVGLPRRKMWDPESMNHVLRHNIGVWSPGGTWFYESQDGSQKYFHPAVWLFWADDFDWEKHQNVYWDTDSDNQRISPWYLTLVGYLLLAGVAGVTVLVCWRCRLSARGPWRRRRSSC